MWGNYTLNKNLLKKQIEKNINRLKIFHLKCDGEMKNHYWKCLFLLFSGRGKKRKVFLCLLTCWKFLKWVKQCEWQKWKKKLKPAQLLLSLKLSVAWKSFIFVKKKEEEKSSEVSQIVIIHLLVKMVSKIHNEMKSFLDMLDEMRKCFFYPIQVSFITKKYKLVMEYQHKNFSNRQNIHKHTTL